MSIKKRPLNGQTTTDYEYSLLPTNNNNNNNSNSATHSTTTTNNDHNYYSRNTVVSISNSTTTTTSNDDHDAQSSSPPLPIPPKHRQDVAILVLFGLLTISGYCYMLSLQGGTFQWMKDHVVQIGSYLMSGIFIFIISFDLVLFLPHLNRKLRVILSVVWLAYVAVIYAWDHDDSMQNHGYFNFVAFMIVFGYTQVVLFMLYGVYLLWTRVLTKKRLRQGVIVALALVLSYGSIRFLVWYNRRTVTFAAGLFGQKLLPAKAPQTTNIATTHVGGTKHDTAICHLDDTAIAWLDIIPPYVQNFWMGQWFGCPSVYHTPRIEFINTESDQPKMQIYCSHSLDVHVQVIPSSLGWEFMEKRKMQEFMMKRIVEKRLRCKSRSDPAVLDLMESDVFPHESFRVSCAKNFEEVHSKIVFFPRRKKQVIERISEKLKSKAEIASKPNILALFLDAVSRKHFQRKFPKTIKVMEAIQKEYTDGGSSNPDTTGIFQFFRYHSVDFSTDDNTRAMWTGRGKYGLSAQDVETVFKNSTVLPPLWHTFRDNGYVTARLDNFCEDWTAKYNQYVADNDHEAITPFCLPEYLRVNAANDLINGPYGIRHRCLSGELVHKYTFDYIKKFWDVYTDVPKFVVSAYIEGHELTGEIIQDVDEDLSQFIAHMKSSGKLDNTIMVVMSDHGLHCGLLPIMTQSGKIEHMNPLQYWFIPNHILSKNSQMKDNLLINSQRLVTAYDIHETLKHVMDLSATPTYPEEADKLPYGRSLFTNDISPLRTCADVRIPPHYCKCQYVQ